MTKRHVVQPGECLSSIAFDHGFAVETLWDEPSNSALRAKRDSPYLLVPGDAVEIPALRPRVEQRAAGAAYQFRRKDVPERVRVQLLDDHGRPRAGLAYSFEIEGRTIAATTDRDGWIEQWVSPNARSALLIIDGELGREEIELRLGHLPPVSEAAGVSARLAALGYLRDEAEAELPFALKQALRAFRRARSLPEGDTVDDATRAELARAYGA